MVLLSTPKAEAYNVCADDGACIHEYMADQARALLSSVEVDEFWADIHSGVGHEDELDHVYGLAGIGDALVTITHFWDADRGPDDKVENVLGAFPNAWQKMQSLWSLALGAYTKGDKKQAYHWLGHVAHLIGDHTIPAHVHDDMHGPDFFDDDSFEEWMSLPGPANAGLSQAEKNGLRATGAIKIPGDQPDKLLWLLYTTNQVADFFASDDFNGDSNDPRGWARAELDRLAATPGLGRVYDKNDLRNNDYKPVPSVNNNNDDDGDLSIIRRHSYLNGVRAIAALYGLFEETVSQGIQLAIVVDHVEEDEDHDYVCAPVCVEVSDPDFYARPSTGGRSFNNRGDEALNDEVIDPGWAFGSSVGVSGSVPVRLEIFDHDGDKDDPFPFGGADDHSDIDPRSGSGDRSLDMSVDLAKCLRGEPGAITGDNSGKCGDTLVSTGDDDDEASQVRFRIVMNNIADAEVSIAGQPNPVGAGERLTLKLKAANKGPHPAHSMLVKTTLPAGVIFVDASVPCASVGVEVTCGLGTVAGGEERSFDVRVGIPADFVVGKTQPVSLGATATVSHLGIDPNGGDNSATAGDIRVIELADLEVSAVDEPDPVPAGTQLTYRLAVLNRGPSVATRPRLTVGPPAGFTFASASAGCLPAAGTVSCDLGQLAPNVTRTAEIRTGVPADFLVGKTRPVSVTSTATVALQGGTDPVAANNTVATTTQVIEVTDLEMIKVDDPDPVAAGTELGYRVALVNRGPSFATKAQFTDALPAGVTRISDDGGCTGVSHALFRCEVGVLGVGQAKEVAVKTLVHPDLVCNNGGPLDVTNTTTATNPAGTDPNPANDIGTAVTYVVDNEITGGAYGQRVGVGPLLLGPSPSVRAPTSGCNAFARSAELARVHALGLFDARALMVSTSGDRSGPDANITSTADVGRVTVGSPLAPVIILENVHSDCRAAQDGTSGSSSIGRLVVNGQTLVNVTVGSNSMIPIPGVGTLYLNEHIRTTRSAAGDVFGKAATTVNAVRLQLSGALGAGDLVLASATCSIEGLNVLR